MSHTRPIQSPASEQKIAAMFDKIAARYDFLNSLLSFRQDKRWRKQLLRHIPMRNQGRMLDVATGTGDVILAAALLRQEYSEFYGVDISNSMLECAKVKQSQRIQDKLISFSQMSAENLTFAPAQFDCVSIAFGLRNVVDRERAIQEFFRVLNSGGRLLILEFFPPRRGLMSRLFQFYFHQILPLIGGLFSDRSAYTYLPQSVGSFYQPGELIAVLENQGFSNVRIKSFMFGSCCLVIADKT